MFKKICIAIFSICLSTNLLAEEKQGPFEAIGEELDEAVAKIADQTAIYTQITKDPLLNPFDIQIRIDKNTAFIHGEVETDIQYDRAIVIVSSAQGIDKINAEHLKVKDSNDIMDDLLITAIIKGKLVQAKHVHGLDMSLWPLKIETKNGTVFVTGEVKSKEIGNNMLDTIHSVDGVTDIKYDLKISDDEQNMSNSVGL